VSIHKLLVANRGEIAIRIFRTCRELGIGTVAVVAPDDAGSLHARSADEAVGIVSYLDAAEHVRAARETGADAIHPGYGFLAESPDFADAVEQSGLVFVGPTADALRRGGDKLAAKEIARSVGVPVVAEGDPAEIGFPLVIKAAAGGGGRGMRVVRDPAELDESLAAARREARAAFGDERVFCERSVERPRHVEIQLLADGSGNVVSLGERECSVQRRHQKVLEESPSVAVHPALRTRMSDAAVAFARAIGYRSAGTAEFMVDSDDFWFLELNGRIQVEHPVTELVTGLDLVAEQLAIGGFVLGSRQFGASPVGVPPRPPNAARAATGRARHAGLGGEGSQSFRTDGHAVEVRLYAEDPRSFLPQAGRIERLRLPTAIRVDAGVEEGDEIGLGYDPMIAKLIAHGRTREEALDRLADALRETEVSGVTTNLPFLRWLVAHPSLRAGETTTAFLVEHPPLSAPPARAPEQPWRGPFRLNLPPPLPAPPPDFDAAQGAHGAGGGESTVTAPMPGTVIRVLVGEGDSVAARQPLLVLEAMKMETPLVSPYKAVVRRVHVSEGDRVAGGAVLVELDE
jgi:acetyl/propionyl-CoA carboxylase alpha subunit